MKRSVSFKPPTTKARGKPSTDKIAAEFAEARARKIPQKDLVWIFRFIAANRAQQESALPGCVECLTAELGKRQRVALEIATVGRRTFQDIVLKLPKATPELLQKLESSLAECCRQSKVSYHSVSYGEDVDQSVNWQTLGTVLQPPAKLSVELDCRTLRFDGLYRHATGDSSGYYLRFYPNGQCIFVSVSDGDASDVARWFSRDWKWATVGSYEVRGPSLSAELQRPAAQGEVVDTMKLKGPSPGKG